MGKTVLAAAPAPVWIPAGAYCSRCSTWFECPGRDTRLGVWRGAVHLMRWWWAHSITHTCAWSPPPYSSCGPCPDPSEPEWQRSSIDWPMRAWLFDCGECGDSVLCPTETAWYDEASAHTPRACQAEADRLTCQAVWDLR